MKNSKLAAGLLSLTLIVTGSLWAQTPKAKAKDTTTKQAAMHTRVATGSIVSATDDSLVLSHRVKGQQEQMTFNLTPATKKDGSLDAGAHATIHYNVENGNNVATTVKATPAKAAASSKKPKS